MTNNCLKVVSSSSYFNIKTIELVITMCKKETNFI